MKHHINDMKRRALHNADAAYYVMDYLAHSFPVQLYEPLLTARAICRRARSPATASRWNAARRYAAATR
jgi:hypothetical protein